MLSREADVAAMACSMRPSAMASSTVKDADVVTLGLRKPSERAVFFRNDLRPMSYGIPTRTSIQLT